MHIHKEEPFYTFAAIDPVALAFFDDETSDRPRDIVWISRRDVCEPGYTVQLKYHMFVTMMRYNEERCQYEGVGRKTGGLGGYRGAISWMSVTGRAAYFQLLDGDEKEGYVGSKLELTTDVPYHIYGWGPFAFTGLRGSLPVFVQQKTDNPS